MTSTPPHPHGHPFPAGNPRAESGGSARDGRRGGTRDRAVLLAVAATVVSLLSLSVAGWSVAVARSARTTATSARAELDDRAQVPAAGATTPVAAPDEAATPGETAVPGEAVTPADTGSPDDPLAATELPPLTNQTVYTPRYEKVTLRVQVSGCSSRDVDLDEPSASTTDVNADITVAGPCSDPAAKIQFGNEVTASEVDDDSVTPTACFNEIRLSPVDQQAAFAARKGRVLCLLTSPTAAKGRGDSQKMVVLSVLGVSEDSTVAIQVTAWSAPR